MIQLTQGRVSVVSGMFRLLFTSIPDFTHSREAQGSVSPPLRLLESSKDAARRVSAALGKAPSGTRGADCSRRCGQPPPGSRRPALTCRYRSATPGAAGPRPAGRRAQGRTHAHTPIPTHTHLLDVLPDGGAVVADDQQLQGVIDEAVLRGRARRRHGQQAA